MATWFILLPGTDPVNPANYLLTGTMPTCTGNKSICAIFADMDVTSRPVITTIVLMDMVRALNNRTSTSSVLLRN